MIGVFDSGSGGLTVVRALQKLAPHADILYLADTANLPYGNKSDDTVKRLAWQMISTLRDAGATTIVSACHSVSAAVIRPMIEAGDVRATDVIEMVGPAVDELRRRHIVSAALIATPITIRSGTYDLVAERYGIRLHHIVCRSLAELIESNAATEEIATAIREALRSIPASCKTVLLGCTHYPLVLEIFAEAAKHLERSLLFVDPAEVVAETALRLHDGKGSGILRIVTTGPTETVMSHAQRILNAPQQSDGMSSVLKKTR